MSDWYDEVMEARRALRNEQTAHAETRARLEGRISHEIKRSQKMAEKFVAWDIRASREFVTITHRVDPYLLEAYDPNAVVAHLMQESGRALLDSISPTPDPREALRQANLAHALAVVTREQEQPNGREETQA